LKYSTNIITFFRFKNHIFYVKKKLKIAIDLTNLFDEEYVAVVNASDDARAGSTSYYVGAPFTAMASVGFEF